MDESLREATEFFAERGRVHATLHRITRLLRKEKIDYAVVGAMALFAHGFRHFTDDVDLLITEEGLDAVHERIIRRGYVAETKKRLRDTQTGVTVKFLVSGLYPGDGKPKAVHFPDPREASIKRDGQNVITLPKLVELKLASGLSAVDRLKDLADVQELIKTVKLPRDLGEQLDPSVRNEYYRIWDASQIIHDPSAN